MNQVVREYPPQEDMTPKNTQKYNIRAFDMYIDVKRLDRIIRILEKRLKKADDEKTIKYANSIGFLTSKKLELTDKVLGMSHLLKKLQQKHGQEINPQEKFNDLESLR